MTAETQGPEGSKAATFSSPLGEEVSARGKRPAFVVPPLATIDAPRASEMVGPDPVVRADAELRAPGEKRSFDDLDRTELTASIIKATGPDGNPDLASLRELRREGIDAGLWVYERTERNGKPAMKAVPTDRSSAQALAAIQRAERQLRLEAEAEAAKVTPATRLPARVRRVIGSARVPTPVGGSTEDPVTVLVEPAATVKPRARRATAPVGSTTAVAPKGAAIEGPIEVLIDPAAKVEPVTSESTVSIASLMADAAPDSPTRVTDPVRHEVAVKVMEGFGLGKPGASSKAEGESPSGDSKEPYDKRNLTRLSPDQASKFAEPYRLLREEALRLATEADALAPKGKRGVTAENRQLAASKRQEAANKELEANALIDNVLAEKERQTETAGKRVADPHEAEYLARRDDRLQMAAIEARDKLGRIQVAEELIEQADKASVQARADYRVVSKFLASEMTQIDDQLKGDHGSHKAEGLNQIREEDRLEAASDLKRLLDVASVPILEQTVEDGKVIELAYKSEKPGNDKLLIIERWDKVTGKLISLNTVVTKGNPRRVVDHPFRPWKAPEIKLSQEVETEMADLRGRDSDWRTSPNNVTRNESALMINMAAMNVNPDVTDRYNPHKKRPANGGFWARLFGRGAKTVTPPVSRT